LPGELDGELAVERIDPHKDVDGLHPFNLGKLLLGRPGLRPCTPSGVIRILEHYDIDLQGKRAVVVGRSFLVGRPLAMMLSARGADATVTLAHSRTENLESLTRTAEILIAAVGVPEMITGEHVSPGAVVIDVGINRVDGRLVGDVAFDEVVEV